MGIVELPISSVQGPRLEGSYEPEADRARRRALPESNAHLARVARRAGAMLGQTGHTLGVVDGISGVYGTCACRKANHAGTAPINGRSVGFNGARQSTEYPAAHQPTFAN